MGIAFVFGILIGQVVDIWHLLILSTTFLFSLTGVFLFIPIPRSRNKVDNVPEDNIKNRALRTPKRIQIFFSGLPDVYLALSTNQDPTSIEKHIINLIPLLPKILPFYEPLWPHAGALLNYFNDLAPHIDSLLEDTSVLAPHLPSIFPHMSLILPHIETL